MKAQNRGRENGPTEEGKKQASNGGQWSVTLHNAEGLIEDTIWISPEAGKQLAKLTQVNDVLASERLNAMISMVAAAEWGEAGFPPLPPLRGTLQFAEATGGRADGKSSGEDMIFHKLQELDGRLREFLWRDDMVGVSIELSTLYEALRFHPSFQRYAEAIRMFLEGPRMLEALLQWPEEIEKRRVAPTVKKAA